MALDYLSVRSIVISLLVFGRLMRLGRRLEHALQQFVALPLTLGGHFRFVVFLGVGVRHES